MGQATHVAELSRDVGLRSLRIARISFTALILAAGLVSAHPVHAQDSAALRTYAIAPQPLSRALLEFSTSSGVQIFFDQAVASGLAASGLSGTYSVDQALNALLAGSGLSYRYTAPTMITVFDPAAELGDASYDGSIMLGGVDVTAWVGAAGGQSFTDDTPYYTAAPISHISELSIDRFRGSSPADILRGTPGVLSGEARNGAGSIDVNIRGMQGMGRVNVTVDGAENALQVYQGYQGISSRTYVDPDFVAGVDIRRGGDVSSFGNAGSVAMRTIDAADIVEASKTFGFRLKTEVGSNTTAPTPGALGGFAYPLRPTDPAVATPSPTGLDRPGLFEFSQWSGSAVAAMYQENLELLAGYSRRSQGNYHAGANGGAGAVADPKNFGSLLLGCSTVDPTACNYWDNYISNAGLTNYRAGEEVLNTQLDTQSALLKGKVLFGDGHTLSLGYNWFNSEAGDRFAARLSNGAYQPIQQAQTSGTELHTVTLRYDWDPADNDLINLRANVWGNWLALRNPPRIQNNVTLESLGLPSDFRAGVDTVMAGAELANTAHFDTAMGYVDVEQGLAYRREDTRPSDGTKLAEQWLDYRDGYRDELAGYVNGSWEPLDWLTLDAGVRYAHYWSQDRNEADRSTYTHGLSKSGGGFSGSLGATVEPIEGVQLYTRYSNALRQPSLFETTSGFTMGANPYVGPERASNWEVGTNLVFNDVVSDGDQASLKFGYFNSTVDDYLARISIFTPTVISMQVENIHQARFSGFELAGRYQNNGFEANLAANYYTNVEFCLTAGNCGNGSLYGDYATNQVPPEYSVSLTLSQKLFEDRLTIGGRVTHVGPRAAGHGAITGQGLQAFISKVDWKPHTLVDVFAEYELSEHLTANFRVENLTDEFYVDPLSLVSQPGPGRTLRLGLTGQF